jgi:hypothetical protein
VEELAACGESMIIEGGVHWGVGFEFFKLVHRNG